MTIASGGIGKDQSGVKCFVNEFYVCTQYFSKYSYNANTGGLFFKRFGLVDREETITCQSFCPNNLGQSETKKYHSQNVRSGVLSPPCGALV